MMDAADFCELAQVGENHMAMGHRACQTSLGLCVNHLTVLPDSNELS